MQNYQNESKFNGVYSRSNLPKIKDGTYVINLDEYKSVGTNSIALCVHGDSVTYFESFGAEQIPKEIKIFICDKNITANIYRIQANYSIMCGSFCIGFINFILKGNNYMNIFSPNEYETNDKIIFNNLKLNISFINTF